MSHRYTAGLLAAVLLSVATSASAQETIPLATVVELPDQASAEWYGDHLVAVGRDGALKVYDASLSPVVEVDAGASLPAGFEVEELEVLGPDFSDDPREWLYYVFREEYNDETSTYDALGVLVDASGKVVLDYSAGATPFDMVQLAGGRRVYLLRTEVDFDWEWDVYDVADPGTLLRRIRPFDRPSVTSRSTADFVHHLHGVGNLLVDADATTGEILLWDSDLTAGAAPRRRLGAPLGGSVSLMPASVTGADTLVDLYTQFEGADPLRVVAYDEAGTTYFDENQAAGVLSVGFRDFGDGDVRAPLLRLSAGAFSGVEPPERYYRQADLSRVSIYDDYSSFLEPSFVTGADLPGQSARAYVFREADEDNEESYVFRDRETLSPLASFPYERRIGDAEYYLDGELIPAAAPTNGLALTYEDLDTEDGRLAFVGYDGEVGAFGQLAAGTFPLEARVLGGALHLLTLGIEEVGDEEIYDFAVVRVGATSGVAEAPLAGVSVGPNPTADGRLTIGTSASPTVTVTATDVLGRRYPLSADLADGATVELPAAAGVYVVTVRDEAGAAAHATVVRR